MTSIALFLNHLRYAISVKGRDEMAVTNSSSFYQSIIYQAVVALIRTVSFFKGILFHKGRIIKMVNVAQSLVFISQMGSTADGRREKTLVSLHLVFFLSTIDDQ